MIPAFINFIFQIREESIWWKNNLCTINLSVGAVEFNKIAFQEVELGGGESAAV